MKKNKDYKKAEYYKERIESFSKFNEDELYDFFKSVKFANIVMSYPASLEKEVYSHFASIVKKKYPQFCDREDIIRTLALYGNIYTGKISKSLGEGIYHINSANIILYSFLNKLNESLVHELLHKLGYLKFNEDFYQMPIIYLEAGTELITNTVLNNPLCREMILGTMWTRSVGVQPRYLIETLLVNQLNVACGQASLERSILEGKNYIEQDIISLIGKEKYNLIFTKMQDICRLEKTYWKSSIRKSKEQVIYKKVLEFQEDVLQEIFGARINKIENKEDAEKLLNELMNFSDFRVKFEDSFESDIDFEKFFKKQKESLEKKFNTTFSVKDVTTSWKDRFPTVFLDEGKLEEEKLQKNKINEMAAKREEKELGFFRRLFKTKKDKKYLSSGIKRNSTSESNIDYLKVKEADISVKVKNSKNRKKEDIEK